MLYALGIPLGWAALHERKRRGLEPGTLRTVSYLFGWPLVGLALWGALVVALLFGAALAALSSKKGLPRG